MAGCALSVLSSVVLLVVASHAGLAYSWKDPLHYLGAGRSLAEGKGLSSSHYDIAEDRLAREPLTHFPPMVSATLAGLMVLGAEPHTAPTIANTACWLLFLAGLAVLTSRLSAAPAAVVYVLGLTTVTWPYLDMFLTVASEPLFLVVLVWLSAALTGLPGHGTVGGGRLAAILGLAALLPLTRYVGVFFLPVLVAWWAAIRWRGTSRRRLVAELAALGLAGVPLLLWLARNWLLTSTLVGTGHAGGAEQGFVLGIKNILTHVTWLLLPALRPGPLWRQFGLSAAVPIVVATLLVGWAAWSGARRPGPTVATPLPWFLAAYLLVYAFLQPFLAFTVMNRRFVTVALCLGMPWMVALCARAPRPLFHLALGSLLVVNAVFLGLVIGGVDEVGELVDGTPPFIHDTAGRPGLVSDALYAGAPRWILHPPARLEDLEEHLPALAEVLAGHGASAAVVSNAPELFPDNPVARSNTAVEDWLSSGTCSTQSAAVVVVVDWDHWSRRGSSLPQWRLTLPPQELIRRIRDKCGELTPTRTDHAWVWALARRVPRNLPRT